MSAQWDIDVRLWKEIPDSFWFLPTADAGPFRIVATSLQAAVDQAATLVDFKPKYFQATRVR